MTALYSTFTDHQKSTYTRVEAIKTQIADTIDPSCFVLNANVVALNDELEQLQEKCDHMWAGKVCLVCGACKKED